MWLLSFLSCLFVLWQQWQMWINLTASLSAIHQKWHLYWLFKFSSLAVMAKFTGWWYLIFISVYFEYETTSLHTCKNNLFLYPLCQSQSDSFLSYQSWSVKYVKNNSGIELASLHHRCIYITHLQQQILRFQKINFIFTVKMFIFPFSTFLIYDSSFPRSSHKARIT